MEKKNICSMCSDCPFCNRSKGICTKTPSEDIEGEIWYCPDYPNIKLMFFCVLNEKHLMFDGASEAYADDIKFLNMEGQNNGWYKDYKLLKQKIIERLESKGKEPERDYAWEEKEYEEYLLYREKYGFDDYVDKNDGII